MHSHCHYQQPRVLTEKEKIEAEARDYIQKLEAEVQAHKDKKNAELQAYKDKKHAELQAYKDKQAAEVRKILGIEEPPKSPCSPVVVCHSAVPHPVPVQQTGTYQQAYPSGTYQQPSPVPFGYAQPVDYTGYYPAGAQQQNHYPHTYQR